MRNFGKLILRTDKEKRGTYAKFKTNFVLEKYLLGTPFSLRANFSRFRVSAHNLAIETGRHTRPVTPVDQRICRECNLNEVEDEMHVLLRCEKYGDKRKEVFKKINDACRNFDILPDSEKFIYLLNSEDEVLGFCLDLINHIFQTRTRRSS